VLAIHKKPNTVNKQDNDADNKQKDKPAMGIDQKLFEARYQKVCNDENDEWRDNKKE